MSKAAAYLFGNGNAMFFDETGEQIIELQRLGLCGLHGFVERYPNAPVYWCIWGHGRLYDWDEIREYVPWLLRHIRKRPGPKPNVACGGE